MLAGGALAIVVLPLVGLLQRVHWSSLGHDLSAREAYTALRLSIVTSFDERKIALVLPSAEAARVLLGDREEKRARRNEALARRERKTDD